MIYVGDTKYKMYVGSTSSKFHIAEPECFYIYHTSSCIIEKRYIKDYPTIDFTTITNVDGNDYGGVFTDYGGKGSIATALDGGQYSSEGVTNIVDDGTPYIGESNVSGAVQMFNVENAITENTTAYTPQVGTIYYIKENPDYVLRRNRLYTYITSTKVLTYYHAFSIIDSLYDSVKLCFKEESDSEFEKFDVNIYKSLKIGSTTYTTQKLFGTFGGRTNVGYLTYINILDKLEAGKTYVYYYEATTSDGITIHSPYKVKLTVTALTTAGTTDDTYPFDQI